jgi:hypothetical protein
MDIEKMGTPTLVKLLVKQEDGYSIGFPQWKKEFRYEWFFVQM